MAEASAPQIPWTATILFVLGAAWTVADAATGAAGGGGDWLLTVVLCAASVAAIVVGGALPSRPVRVAVAAAALLGCLAGLYRGGLHFLPACVALVVETCLPQDSDPPVWDGSDVATRDRASLVVGERHH